MLFGWVSLADYARQNGIHPKTLKRWLLKANRPGLMRTLPGTKGRPGKYLVHPESLKAALAADPEAEAASRAETEAKLEASERKLEALRKAYKQLQAKLRELEKALTAAASGEASPPPPAARARSSGGG